MSDRYEGKPFLRLLDSYVLDAIGHLDQSARRELTASETDFRKMFGVSGDWHTIVEKRMQFPAGMPAAIREVWDKGAVKFREANGYEPEPRTFTEHFVDSNFPH